MDNPRPDKVAVVDEVRTHLAEADAVIVTEYRGLKVKDLAALRRGIAPLGADYKIYKNTLVRIAADQSPDGFSSLLSGPTALAFVQGDAAAVTKALREFARTNPLLLIKGGLLGDSVLGPEATSALADLPSREVLLARLAGALAAPMQSLAGLVAAIPRNFAYGLAALRDKRAEGGEPEPVSPSASAVAEPPIAADAPAAEEPAAEEPATPAEPSAVADAPVAAQPAPAADASGSDDTTPAAEDPTSTESSSSTDVQASGGPTTSTEVPLSAEVPPTASPTANAADSEDEVVATEEPDSQAAASAPEDPAGSEA
jgi:large subunit ribosomal protein L10